MLLVLHGFMIVYSRANGAVGLATVLGWCVIPFIIPDIIKIVLAYGLSRKLRKFVADLFKSRIMECVLRILKEKATVTDSQ